MIEDHVRVMMGTSRGTVHASSMGYGTASGSQNDADRQTDLDKSVKGTIANFTDALG